MPPGNPCRYTKTTGQELLPPVFTAVHTEIQRTDETDQKVTELSRHRNKTKTNACFFMVMNDLREHRLYVYMYFFNFILKSGQIVKKKRKGKEGRGLR